MVTEKTSPLRQLRKDSGLTAEEFAKQFSIGVKTQTAYENGKRNMPTDYMVNVCNKYDVTADWLLERSEYRNDNDLMVKIICALDRIFRVGYKTIRNPHNDYEHRELTLWMDKTFREYLAEIRELQSARYFNRQITDELYSISRRKIQDKYKEYLQQLFNVTSCEIDKSKFINIEAVEDGDFLNFL